LAGISAVWNSVREARIHDACDFYILSDTADPALRQAEDRMLEELRRRFPQDARTGRLQLVRRLNRVHFKAGNIANFLENHAAGYDYLLVLDADSVMSGSAIRRLISRMQRTAFSRWPRS
jgi:membrane glycosyltransferase